MRCVITKEDYRPGLKKKKKNPNLRNGYYPKYSKQNS